MKIDDLLEVQRWKSFLFFKVQSSANLKTNEHEKSKVNLADWSGTKQRVSYLAEATARRRARPLCVACESGRLAGQSTEHTGQSSAIVHSGCERHPALLNECAYILSNVKLMTCGGCVEDGW